MNGVKDVQELFIYEIQNLETAEGLMRKQLNLFIKKTIHPSVKDALIYYQPVTEEHKERLENVQASFEEAKAGLRNDNKTVRALVDEINDLLSFTDGQEITDSIILHSLLKISYFKIAGYRSALACIRKMNAEKTGDILRKTLNEEYDENDLLARLSEVIMTYNEEENEEQKKSMPGGPGASVRGSRREANDDEEAEHGSSTRHIYSPGGRAGTSHRSYPGGESRGH